MKVTPTAIPDVVVIDPERHRDERGSLVELWNPRRLADSGLSIDFVQDNLTWSGAAGVVRGLHFQAPPSAQGKLVACATGAIYDVAVDIRTGSPTYGQHVGVELSEANARQLWIPAGFAHGYCTLEPDCRIIYKLDGPYAPELAGGLLWNDPALGIDWPVGPGVAVVNERDRNWPPLSEFSSPFVFAG